MTMKAHTYYITFGRPLDEEIRRRESRRRQRQSVAAETEL